MNRWFDSLEWPLSVDMREDVEGIVKARDVIKTLIEKEVESGIGEQKVVLGGFSQGGALAVRFGL